jgi:thiamine-phosphate pyrophosphorylase
LSERPDLGRLRPLTPRLSIGPAPAPAPREPGRVRFRLCLITDGQGDARRLLEILGAALPAGPPGALAVQLRERTLPGAALYALAEQLRALTAACGAALLINDRLDVALAVGADGVHLPTHGLPVGAARRAVAAVGAPLLLSAACHSLPEAQMAVTAGADLITYGPIWPTPSKPAGPLPPDAERLHPVGVEALRALTAAVAVPVFALGGIEDEARAAACVDAGARLAGIRVVLGAADPAAATRALLACTDRRAAAP